MACDSLEEMVQLLEGKERFGRLINRYNKNNQDRSFWFELAFACWMESNGYKVEYEVKTNPDNDSSIDYALDLNEHRCLFELLRVENSDEVRAYIEAQQEQDPLFESYQLILNSDHKNPHFTTAAQIIRLQEKILDKVQKFPTPENTMLSIIVCDCSTVHQGQLDDEDVRITMFGASQNNIWQEYWGDNRLMGMYETDYNFRGSDEFSVRVDAVIFLPNLEPDGLDNAMITLNPEIDDEKKENFIDILKDIKCLENLNLVESAL